jgi:hypothetical protein
LTTNKHLAKHPEKNVETVSSFRSYFQKALFYSVYRVGADLMKTKIFIFIFVDIEEKTFPMTSKKSHQFRKFNFNTQNIVS